MIVLVTGDVILGEETYTNEITYVNCSSRPKAHPD